MEMRPDCDNRCRTSFLVRQCSNQRISLIILKRARHWALINAPMLNQLRFFAAAFLYVRASRRGTRQRSSRLTTPAPFVRTLAGCERAGLSAEGSLVGVDAGVGATCAGAGGAGGRGSGGVVTVM